jgi:septal ring factor EnvC (AmiA/AmiB activator)
MSTEITEVKCPFMSNGGFICIRRKCALYAEDKCSISYLPNIAKEKQEKTETELNIENTLEEVEDKVSYILDKQAFQNTDITWLKEAVVGIQTLTQQVNALKTKGETLEKTLAMLKKEFAEVEKQVKRKK